EHRQSERWRHARAEAPQPERQRGEGAGDCTDGRERPPRGAAEAERPQRAAHVGEDGKTEETVRDREVGRHRFGRRSRAARMPRRISAGSGGQPATNTSTGTTAATLPTTA